MYVTFHRNAIVLSWIQPPPSLQAARYLVNGMPHFHFLQTRFKGIMLKIERQNISKNIFLSSVSSSFPSLKFFPLFRPTPCRFSRCA